MSGAVPPPAARPLERAARVPRPVCPGCGRCGRGDPAPAPRRAPLRAGVACRGGGGRASPGGAFHRCEGRLVSGAVPPPAARPLERAAGVPRPVCPGCGRFGRGDPAPAPQRALLRASVARCGNGGRASPGGVLSTVVRGARCHPLSLPRPPILWSRQPGFRDPCVPGAFDACVGTQHRPHSVRPCGSALPSVGVAEERPRGVAFHHCEGRLVSGAVPPPAIHLLERAARVPRPVCPGCGRCGRGDPAPVPQRAPLRAGVARRGGGRRASPRGVFSTVVRGAWCQALSLPWPPVLWSGQPGFRVPGVPGAVGAGVGTQHRSHSVRPCGPALLAVVVAEGRPRWGAFHRCGGRPVSGAVPPLASRPLERAARVPRPVCPGCGRCGRGDRAPAPQRAPLRAGVARCGGGGRASPWGVLSTVARGAWCQALSLPRPPVLWRGQPGFRVPCVPGAVGAGPEIQHRPRSVRPCGPALLAAGLAEGRPPGGGAFHRCEGRMVSGAVPPLAARPLERAARVPRPACRGCGRCGRGDSAPAPQPAPLRAGVARCGGGGRASPGGVPSTVVRGAWCQALSLPRPPVLWSGQPGFRVPCVPVAVGAGVGTHHRPHSVRPCGLALHAVRVAEGRPRGGCFPPL